MPETKMVDREKDGKIGPESEINDRSGPEPKASGGNSMAAVDRASTYSDPDKDKQFDQKGSDRIVSDTKVVEVGIKKSGHKLADDTQKVTKKVKDKI